MTLTRRQFGRLAVVPAVATAAATTTATTARAATAPTRAEVLAAMRRAAAFLDEHVSYRGAYVWNYLPDLSRSWGEMEANRTMCWVQPPGTPSVGHAMLDAYHATGDEVFLRAAERTGLALVAAQLPVGGWNYVHDFAGTASLRRWYRTVGANGWRLEEFQHHYGNATFDDAGTASAAQLVLRLYLERRDPRFRASLERAIRFVLKAQFRGGVADGGWPQRFPRFSGSVAQTPWPDQRPSWLPDDVAHGMEDGEYTQHVTFNDDVLGENVKFLLMCMSTLDRDELAGPVRRAMSCLRRLQQPAPQAGWGLQHLSTAAGGRPAGAPAGARSYEPRALATHTTQTNVRQLFHYFRLTGDRAFLTRVPEAIAWLDSCPLTDQQVAENPLLAGRTHPTFVELGTNRARFVHRFGSNVRNGAYYFDHDHRRTLSHYSAGRAVDTASLRATYDELMSLSDEQVADLRARSPLSGGAIPLPRFFSLRDLELTDLFRDAPLPLPAVTDAEAGGLVADLGDKDHWLTPVDAVTNPYRGAPPATPYDGQAYMSKHVGDLHDTSPYDPRTPPEEPPYQPQERPLVISTSAFVANMGKLVAWTAR
ncbi:pectate lyase [Saccharothrix coeruleofusca]|uniref:Pectate lyase n=1 Tax=Saccharothrix coeruleofusca TaxID=33919 RepID=A0A918AK75_9PSEU|nr:pectate lyase [Saccharothrix coeruleofusca]GGP51862.1 pectate lyase [Saccharothrix coeruleofusca]